nr:wiskott-Aldrich syndrome protein family member 1-like [Aegilops tauschii subsp. strangulata]
MAAPPRPVSPAHTRTHGRGRSPCARSHSRCPSSCLHRLPHRPPAVARASAHLLATPPLPGPLLRPSPPLPRLPDPMLAAAWPAPTHRATPPPPPPMQLAHAAARLTSDASPGRRLAAVAQPPHWPHPGQRPHARTLTGLCPQRPNARAPANNP